MFLAAKYCSISCTLRTSHKHKRRMQSDNVRHMQPPALLQPPAEAAQAKSCGVPPFSLLQVLVHCLMRCRMYRNVPPQVVPHAQVDVQLHGAVLQEHVAVARQPHLCQTQRIERGGRARVKGECKR